MNDIERDIKVAESLIGKPNSYFESIYKQFANSWDGVPCSEIACCISYLGGNLNTIKVSNYAQGLVNNFKAMNRFGSYPLLGAFIFFGYNEPNHTGRVVEIKPNAVVAVEGNINNKVVKREYPRDSSYIWGYGYPKYAIDTDYLFINASINYFYLTKDNNDKNLIFWLQMFLYNKGYYRGDLDGEFGDYTKKALEAYQNANGLVKDGEAGYYTLKKILGL